MGLPELKTCCCYFELKTGNIIAGTLNAMLSFGILVTMIVVAAMAGSVQEAIRAEDDPEMAAAATGFYAMSIILVIMYLFKFFLDLSFIYAVVVGNTRIIKGYLILWVALFLLSSFVFFLNYNNFKAFTIVSMLLFKAYNIYAILVAHSYYKQLNIREEI